MISRKVLLWSICIALLLLGCSAMRKIRDGAMDAGESDAASDTDGSDRDATVDPVPEGSPCDTRVYTKNGIYTVDLTWTTTLKACLSGDDDVVRVDAEGSPICENLSRPPMDIDRSGEASPHECESDSDCPSGTVCMCAVGVHAVPLASIPDVPEANRCVPAECTSASDCGGWACGLSGEHGAVEGFFCRSSKDDCSSNLECEPYEKCVYYSGKWTCRTTPAF